MKLYFNYSLDCETPVNTEYTGGMERESFFNGPDDWDAAEASVRGFAKQMQALGVIEGASLFVYPDVARHQKVLYCEMADMGIEVGLHLNGMRYSKLTGDDAKWLGSMSDDEQREALRMGKEDLEESLGREVQGYRACYGSANLHTLGICHDVGFTWTSNASNRHRPEFHSYWADSYRYTHHADAESNLVCGDLPLVEIPLTVGITVMFDEAIQHPLDLRAETTVDRVGENRERLRAVIEENLEDMEKQSIPLRTIIGGSHNTNPFGSESDFRAQNLDWVVRHTRELADERGLKFTPASFGTICDEVVPR